MNQAAKPLTNLPSDILFQIFNECDVPDILNLSRTCKQLQQVTNEHQVWLDQARHLQIPIAPGATPTKAELKDLVVSRTRVDFCWTKSRPGELTLHSFETQKEFVDAHLLPGGEFVVVFYPPEIITLNGVEESVVAGELDLREVAKYEGMDWEAPPCNLSKLLTGTSYGCPVLVALWSYEWEDPSIYLVDPVSQVIEKKACAHCNFNGHWPGDGPDSHKILAVKDRIFFVYNELAPMDDSRPITVLNEPNGPHPVVRNFCLRLSSEIEPSYEARTLVVSENCLVVTNEHGIFLYHIPELEAVDDGSDLFPVWDWRGDASDLRGTVYNTASLLSSLWLQGSSATHALEFAVDESGCFPVVVNHSIAEEPLAFNPIEHIKLKGRKGMCIEGRRGGEFVFHTRVPEDPKLTRQLHASLRGLDGHPWRDELKYVDLDELTGRIMIVAGRPDSGRRGNYPYARRFYIADLPV